MNEIFAQIGIRKIAWTAIGLIGAAVATYWAIKNTNGPRERAFIVRAFVLWWIANFLFVGGVFLVAKPYNRGLYPLYLVPVLLAARYINTRQAAIRAEESDNGA